VKACARGSARAGRQVLARQLAWQFAPQLAGQQLAGLAAAVEFEKDEQVRLCK